MIKELKQQLVKDTILGESKKQFVKKGIQKTTLRSIAKELNIAFGNIYYYFKSKMTICDVLWMDYTNTYLDHIVQINSMGIMKDKTGLEKLEYYYATLFDYFKENPLYAELIAFSMGEKPRFLRVPGEMREQVRETTNRLQNTLIDIYKEGISDGSIKADISSVFHEAWSFNISYVAIVINIIRYNEIDKDVYDYYVDTYLNRLSKPGGKNEVEFKT
ncbi:TetR/AcrR family transcriptional regulator [Candidatus Cloacimonadota bacterium]